MAILIDSYSEANYSNNYQFYTGQYSGMGQAITITSPFRLYSAKFYLSLSGVVSGPMVAKLYSITGSVGTTAKPTGAALATSDGMDASILTTSPTLIEFSFNGSNRYEMTTGDYGIAFEWSGGGDASNYVAFGVDLSAPTHTGNKFNFFSGSWTANDTEDAIFYLYGATGARFIKNNIRPRAFAPGLAR